MIVSEGNPLEIQHKYNRNEKKLDYVARDQDPS
jgi:hypothetical protein